MKRFLGWSTGIVVSLALIAALAGWAVRASRSRITISKQTTFITQPLRADGTVDYLAALNARASQGVTPENNAAVLFWKAMGPAEILPKYRGEYFKILGISPLPEKGDYFVTLEKYAKQLVAREKVGDAAKMRDQMREQLDQAVARPWSAQEFPRLAGWLTVNEKPLALLIEASRRPRRYDPLIPKGMVLGALLPALGQFPDVLRVLTARAMLRTHAGNNDKAWADLLACHRLARLAGQGITLIDALVGIISDLWVCQVDHALLQYGRPRAGQIAQMRGDFTQLPAWGSLVDHTNEGERILWLDTITFAMREGPPGLRDIESNVHLPRPLANWAWMEADPNHVLRRANSWMDRWVVALSKSSRAQRTAATKDMDKEFNAELDACAGWSWHAVTTPSKYISVVFLRLFWPAQLHVSDPADRHAMQFELTKLAFALAEYRAERKSYPETLNDLAPKYVTEVPKDIFNNDRPLHYKRQGDGYLLYSVGLNGKDDGGRTAEDRKGNDDAVDWDDIVVRMPAQAQTFDKEKRR